jgi:hypothetical protein
MQATPTRYQLRTNPAVLTALSPNGRTDRDVIAASFRAFNVPVSPTALGRVCSQDVCPHAAAAHGLNDSTMTNAYHSVLSSILEATPWLLKL